MISIDDFDIFLSYVKNNFNDILSFKLTSLKWTQMKMTLLSDIDLFYTDLLYFMNNKLTKTMNLSRWIKLFLDMKVLDNTKEK